ncbi:hypothetical protein [Phosphitispora sp. TUW77]|uniref:hypothetical protein n=1 Tax=Phosphitispora sp. TUW77 TaxID=3152361 RepID=UPI003AB2EE1B
MDTGKEQVDCTNNRCIKKILVKLLDSDDKNTIESVHQKQEIRYGVYIPPSLKQLSSLRYLLERTGFIIKVHPHELLGLSKAECKMLLNKLNEIYIKQRRKYYWNEVEIYKNVSR